MTENQTITGWTQSQPHPTTLLKQLAKAAATGLREKKQAWCNCMYQRTSQNEFLRTIGIPTLFTPIAPYIWAVVLALVFICSIAEWLEGGAI